MGDERQLRSELLEAAQGKTPDPEGCWTKPQAFDAYFSGAGSQNIWLMRFATQALNKTRPVPWEAVYHYQLGPPAGTKLIARGGTLQVAAETTAEDKVYTPGFGGSEFMSTIYWGWHLMSHLALTRAQGEIAKQARRWVVLNWVLLRAIEAPDGSLMLFGQRSAGHNPIPREMDWFYALARSENDKDGRIKQAEKWCKIAGAGLKQSWEFEAGTEFCSEMRETYQESLAIPIEDLPRLLPLRVATDIVRTTEGIAVVHAGNCNPNTPPILVGTFWADGRREVLPTSEVEGKKVPGGIRIRQKFDHAAARIEGNEIVYSSSLYTGGKEQRIPLPGGEVIYHLKLGRGDAAPTLPTLTPPTPPPTGSEHSAPIVVEPPRPRDLTRAADLIAGLLLPNRQKPLQGQILARLRGATPSDAEIAEIAAQVETFGIGPGQAQAVPWREAITILKS